MAESYRSGESASVVARRHGVQTSVLFRWRRRYRTSADTGAGFVPVVVEAPEPSSEAAPGRMEIVLGEEVRVIVDATVHAPAWRGKSRTSPQWCPSCRFASGVGSIGFRLLGRGAYPDLHSCTISSKPFKLFIMATPFSRKRQTPRIQATERPVSPVPKLSAKPDFPEATACGRCRHVSIAPELAVFLVSSAGISSYRPEVPRRERRGRKCQKSSVCAG